MAEKKDSKDKDSGGSGMGEEGAEEASGKKKLAGKTLVLFIILPALLILGGGGAAAVMLLGGGDKAQSEEADHGEEAADAHGEAEDSHGEKDSKKEAKKSGHGEEADHGGAPVGEIEVGHIIPGKSGEPSYYDMPKIIVNLAGQEGERPLLLELELVLESGDPAQFDKVPELMPRLMDQIQTFLRELRVEDLDGSAGTYRLRLELLKRFNNVIAPDKIDAVLIEGILVQ